MQASFFEALSGARFAKVIGAGIRWLSPWINDGGVRRQFVIGRVTAG